MNMYVYEYFVRILNSLSSMALIDLVLKMQKINNSNKNNNKSNNK